MCFIVIGDFASGKDLRLQCYWYIVIFFWIFSLTDQWQHGFHCWRRKLFCFSSVLMKVLPKICAFILEAHSQNVLCFFLEFDTYIHTTLYYKGRVHLNYYRV